MQLIYKNQLIIQKLIFVFLILFNPLMICSIANTKYADKSEINKKLAESNEELNTDSKSINEALNEAKELIPQFDYLVENESFEKIEINSNLKGNEELKGIKNENDFLKNYNLDDIGDLSNPKNDSIQRKIIRINLNNKKIENEELKENYLATPTVGKISVGEFEIPTRGYIKLKEEKLTLNLVKADAIEKVAAKVGEAFSISPKVPGLMG